MKEFDEYRMETKEDFAWPPHVRWIQDFSMPYSLEYYLMASDVTVTVRAPSIRKIHSIVHRLYVWEAEQAVAARERELRPRGR